MSKWIFNKHTKDFETLMETLFFLDTNSSKNNDNINDLMVFLNKSGMYKSRDKTSLVSGNRSTITNKISVLKFYGLVYETNKIYMISSLGKEILKHYNNKDFLKLKYAFINSLYNIQFHHPYNRSHANVYPFRMIISLMNEERLDYKLHNYEIIKFLFDFDFESTSIESRKKEYENLIIKILDYRIKKNNNLSLISEDISKIDSIADKVHQWDYYVSSILSELGIIRNTVLSNNFTHFQQGKEDKHGKKTMRKFYLKDHYIAKESIFFITNLNAELPCYENTINRTSQANTKDWVTIVMNCISKTYISQCTDDIKYNYYKTLFDELVYHAKNNEVESPYQYEDLLEQVFNEFEDVNAVKVGGAGSTDVECVFDETTKFNVEAKSTSKKLMSINAGRLNHHIALAGAEYALVISPDYAPSAVKYDIKNNNICAVRTVVFAEYIQNSFLNDYHSYSDLNNIIKNNYGSDISTELEKLSATKFGKVI